MSETLSDNPELQGKIDTLCEDLKITLIDDFLTLAKNIFEELVGNVAVPGEAIQESTVASYGLVGSFLKANHNTLSTEDKKSIRTALEAVSDAIQGSSDSSKEDPALAIPMKSLRRGHDGNMKIKSRQLTDEHTRVTKLMTYLDHLSGVKTAAATTKPEVAGPLSESSFNVSKLLEKVESGSIKESDLSEDEKSKIAELLKHNKSHLSAVLTDKLSGKPTQPRKFGNFGGEIDPNNEFSMFLGKFKKIGNFKKIENKKEDGTE